MEHGQTVLKATTLQRATWTTEAANAPVSPLDLAWADLPSATLDVRLMRKSRIFAAVTDHPAAAAFDMLRTRVLHLLHQNAWGTVAITSPTAGAGKSVVALNLAFSLSNLAHARTVLLDLDLRQPNLAPLLGIRSAPRMEDYLAGRIDAAQAFQRLRPNLAVGANGRQVSLSAELLQSPDAAASFQAMRDRLKPDVVLCDLPAMRSSDDLLAFAGNVDCAILVTEAERDSVELVDACEQELARQTNVLGVVLNKCRHMDAAR